MWSVRSLQQYVACLLKLNLSHLEFPQSQATAAASAVDNGISIHSRIWFPTMCDFAGTQVDFWSGPESWDFGRDHSSHTANNGWEEFPSAISRSLILVFPRFKFFSWPTFTGHHQLTKNQNTQTTARSFYLMEHLIWWLLPGNWWCLGLPSQCSVSPPCYLEGATGARVIVLRWQEVIAIVIWRRKVIAMAQDKGDTLGLQFRILWVSFWISQSAFTKFQDIENWKMERSNAGV